MPGVTCADTKIYRSTLPAVLKYNEAEVLKRVAEGDESAFRQIFDGYWDTVYGVAMALTKSPDLAEEMAQDIFVRIWVKREKLAAVEKFEGYLFTIARNHIYNEFRRSIKVEAFTDHLLDYVEATALATDTPDRRLLCSELEKLVDKAVEQLPPQQRTIYRLSRHQGLSQEEIAHSLHISVHTVKSHMNKALHVIRGYLRHHATLELLLLFYFCMVHHR